MIISTHAYDTLRSTSPGKAKCDQYTKEFLADVQILARIVQYTVTEFESASIEEIIACIETDSIEVGKIPMEQGQTNYGKVHGESTENIVLNEGTVYFDVRFSIIRRDERIKIIINLEAQRSSDSKKLGYHIENRIIYYLSRLISSQKEVEFFKSNYDDIKKVYSIWICMDAEDDADGISQISLCEKTLYGMPQNLEQLDKMCGIIIHIRKNDNLEESRNKLISMLEDAFSNESCEKKKEKLEEKHGIKMTIELERRVNQMCNISDFIEERAIKSGLEKGMAQGMAQGMEQAETQMAKKLFQNGVSYELVKSSINTLTEEKLTKIYEEALATA